MRLDALIVGAVALLAPTTGCTAPIVLPQVEEGQPVPAHAARVYFAEPGGELTVAVFGPGDTRSRARRGVSDWVEYREVFDFVTAELRAAELHGAGDEPLPLVIFSDGAASASRALYWLPDLTGERGWAGPRLETYIGLGDIENPRMIEAPRRIEYRSRAPLFTLLLNSPRVARPAMLCIPPLEHGGDAESRCVDLIDDEAVAPASPGGWSVVPLSASGVSRLAAQLCDALGEPFDITWDDGTLEEFAQLLVDDPRPSTCRGNTWLGHPSGFIIRTLRPREVPQWDAALDRREPDPRQRR